jgi:hypothetical protein
MSKAKENVPSSALRLTYRTAATPPSMRMIATASAAHVQVEEEGAREHNEDRV